MHTEIVKIIFRKFNFESVNIVNRIIDTYSHCNGSDGNSHNIERNTKPAHNAEHEGCGNRIWNNADHRDRQRAEQQQEHQHDDKHHYAKSKYLRFVKALQNIVVEDENPCDIHLVITEAKFFLDAALNSLQQFVALEIRVGFDYPHVKAQLIFFYRDKGFKHRVF